MAKQDKSNNIILKHTLLNAVEHNGKANPKAVLGKTIAEEPCLKKQIKAIIKEIDKTINEVNAWDLERQKQELEKFGKIEKPEKKEREGLKDLPNAEKGKVIMRLAPFPSGPLHIGNAKQFIINDYYVKKYCGKLFLFIDDTIGSEKKQIVKDAYKLIPEGLKWLGIDFDEKIYYKSDRLEIYYQYAEELIKKKKAYVCECDFQTLRENRMNGKACKCRKNTIKKNMENWKKMLEGKYNPGEAVLRIKTDMKHPNPAFRDRVMLRITGREHPRTGNKYKVWPLLEFAFAIDDHLLGVTHILRGKDLMMESEIEKYIWDIFGWKHPEIIHTGFLFIEGVKLSKSKAQLEVESGRYTGWDDPRTWSLQSLRKRGLSPDAIRKFILGFGVTEHEARVPVDKLYSEDREVIDQIACRFFLVAEPIEISLDRLIMKTIKVPVYPGKRKYRKIPASRKMFVDKLDFIANRAKEVRLMHFCNIILDKDSKVTGKANKDIRKIHWVPSKNVKVKLVMPDGNIVNGLAEPEIKNVKANDIVQFERLGFARCDQTKPELIFCFAHK